MNTADVRLRVVAGLLEEAELTDEHLALIIHRLTGPMGERFFAPSDQEEFVIYLQPEKPQEAQQEVLDTSHTLEPAQTTTEPAKTKGIRRKEDYRIPIGDHPVDHEERLCKYSKCQKRLVREIDETPSHFKRRVVCKELCRRLLASEKMTQWQREKWKKEITSEEEPAPDPSTRQGGHCEIHGDYLHGPNGCPSCEVAVEMTRHRRSAGSEAGYRITGDEA